MWTVWSVCVQRPAALRFSNLSHLILFWRTITFKVILFPPQRVTAQSALGFGTITKMSRAKQSWQQQKNQLYLLVMSTKKTKVLNLRTISLKKLKYPRTYLKRTKRTLKITLSRTLQTSLFMLVLIWCLASVCCWLLLSLLDMPFPELHYLICSGWLRCTVLPNFCANTSKLLRDFVKKLKSPIELHYYCCFCQEYFGPEKPQHVQIQLVWWTLSRRNHSCTILLLYPLYTNLNQ